MEEETTLTNNGLSRFSDEVVLDASGDRSNEARERLRALSEACSSLLAIPWVGCKRIAKRLRDDIRDEFGPILKHGIVSSSIVLMLAGLQWLVTTLEATSVTENLQEINSVLYAVVYIYLGFSTVVHLLLNFLEHTLPKWRILRSKKAPGIIESKFIRDVCKELYPIVKLGIITALIVVMLSGLHELSTTAEAISRAEEVETVAGVPEKVEKAAGFTVKIQKPTGLSKVSHNVDTILYAFVLICLSISTLVQLILILFEHALPRLRKVFSNEAQQRDCSEPLGEKGGLGGLNRGAQILSSSEKGVRQNG